jgi:cytochrome c-type biogenesis protein CcmH
VIISARISRSGTAKPQPGDLQGASGPVANDAGSVRVTIDSVVK